MLKCSTSPGKSVCEAASRHASLHRVTRPHIASPCGGSHHAPPSVKRRACIGSRASECQRVGQQVRTGGNISLRASALHQVLPHPSAPLCSPSHKRASFQRLRTIASARTSCQAALHHGTMCMDLMRQPCIAWRMAAVRHVAPHLITYRRNCDAPRHVLTRFNITTPDAACEDATLPSHSPICRFAAASDGIHRLPLPWIGSCAIALERNKDLAVEAPNHGRSSDRGATAVEPAGVHLVLPALLAAAIHEGQRVSRTIGSPAQQASRVASSHGKAADRVLSIEREFQESCTAPDT